MRKSFMSGVLVCLAVVVGFFVFSAFKVRPDIQASWANPFTNFRVYTMYVMSYTATELAIPQTIYAGAFAEAKYKTIRNIGTKSIYIGSSNYVGEYSSYTACVSNISSMTTYGYEITTASGTNSIVTINTTLPIYAIGAPGVAASSVTLMYGDWDNY